SAAGSLPGSARKSSPGSAAEHPPGSAASAGGVLDRLRGAGAAKRHNARTVAALTGNPGCTRRAVLDAAGVDKVRLAERIGFPGAFGQSRFALARGNAFEAMLKADDCALLRSTLGAYVGGYDARGADEDDTLSARHSRTRSVLAKGAEGLLDHPLL